MARKRRKLSDAKPQFGNNVPFSIKKTRRQFKPNMQNKRIYVPEYDRWVRVKLSTSELKTIDKIGFREFLKRKGVSLQSIMDED